MSDLPSVSIVTPSYNQGAFLRAAIDSVLSQDIDGLEYIVMDGGSTDGSAQIVAEYSESLAHWESARDGGQSDAIRKGFERAAGEVFGFLNSDDLLLPGALEYVQCAFAEEPGLDVLVGAGSMIDKDGEYLYGVYPLAWGAFPLLTGRSIFMQPSVFYRQRAYRQAGGIHDWTRHALDLDLFTRMALAGAKHRITRRKLSATRLHAGTKTANQQDVMWEEIGKIQEEHSARLSALKVRWFLARQRIGHAMLRCRYDGVWFTLTHRSRGA